MLYDAYEAQNAVLSGANLLADLGSKWAKNPFNPVAYSQIGHMVASGLDVFAHASQPRGKPEFGFTTTAIADGREVSVTE